MHLNTLHHIAIICADYEKSKAFYTNILGLTIIKETYRKERGSYTLDLALNEVYLIELFSFSNPPKRVSRPEACGLRHLAFKVDDIGECIKSLTSKGVHVEKVRVDENTHKKFTFFADPDGLPIELYEA